MVYFQLFKSFFFLIGILFLNYAHLSGTKLGRKIRSWPTIYIIPITLQHSTSVTTCSYTCKHSPTFHFSSLIFLELHKVYHLLQLLPDTHACEVSSRLEVWRLGLICIGTQWVRLPKGARPALFPRQSPIHWIMSATSPVCKPPSRETDRSPPSRAETKNK